MPARATLSRRHLAVAAGGRQGGRAAATGNIEHAAPGPEVDRFAQPLTHDDLLRADLGEVAGCPHLLLALLDRAKIGT